MGAVANFSALEQAPPTLIPGYTPGAVSKSVRKHLNDNEMVCYLTASLMVLCLVKNGCLARSRDIHIFVIKVDHGREKYSTKFL